MCCDSFRGRLRAIKLFLWLHGSAEYIKMGLWLLERLIQGGGSDVVSVSCFGVRFSVMFHFMFVHYTFSSVWVAEWPPFWK